MGDVPDRTPIAFPHVPAPSHKAESEKQGDHDGESRLRNEGSYRCVGVRCHRRAADDQAGNEDWRRALLYGDRRKRKAVKLIPRSWADNEFSRISSVHGTKRKRYRQGKNRLICRDVACQLLPKEAGNPRQAKRVG